MFTIHNSTFCVLDQLNLTDIVIDDSVIEIRGDIAYTFPRHPLSTRLYAPTHIVGKKIASRSNLSSYVTKSVCNYKFWKCLHIPLIQGD